MNVKLVATAGLTLLLVTNPDANYREKGQWIKPFYVIENETTIKLIIADISSGAAMAMNHKYRKKRKHKKKRNF